MKETFVRLRQLTILCVQKMFLKRKLNRKCMNWQKDNLIRFFFIKVPPPLKTRYNSYGPFVIILLYTIKLLYFYGLKSHNTQFYYVTLKIFPFIGHTNNTHFFIVISCIFTYQTNFCKLIHLLIDGIPFVQVVLL